MPDLDYAKVIGRFGLDVADTAADPDFDPDLVWCSSGRVIITPKQPETKVPAGTPVPYTLVRSSYEAAIDEDGYLTWNGDHFINVVDLTSDKVNPRFGPGLATHTVTFADVRATLPDGSVISVSIERRDVRLTKDGPDGSGVNDLTLVSPVIDGTATPITQGPPGASVTSAAIVGDTELVFGLSDGTEVSAGDLPAATTAITAAGTATTAAGVATTKAGEAATSATAAAGSASTATTKAGEASSSAATASTKAGEAASSATAAAGSASTATTKAGEAASSASTADTAKTDAQAARDAAQGYAAAADASADAAAADAATIAGAVSAATGAASTATTKAGEASDSAAAADASADAAAASAADAAASAAEAADGGVQKVNGLSPDGAGNVALTQDNVPDGTTNKAFTATEKTKLAGLAAIATSGSASDITTGTLPTSVLPPLAVNETFTVANQAAMLALTAQRGDMAIRSDNGRTYVLSSDSPSTLADWKEVMAAGQVQSVAGKTGVVSLVKGDVGLGNVDNTADTAKPVSTAQQAALDAKVPTTRTVSAGTGLTGGGDLAADRTLAVSYGTTAGTAAQGNDSRITGAVQNGGGAATLRVLTQAAYNAIGTKDANTIYVVVG